jgi:serine protease Do
MRDLPRAVAEAPVGKAVQVRVLRKGQEILLDVTLGRLEVGEQLIASADKSAAQTLPGEQDPITLMPGLDILVGFDVGPIDPAAREAYALDPSLQGVMVTTVRDGSEAYEKGFLPGFVIVEVNQRAVATVDDVTAIVGEAKEAGRPAVLFKVIDPTGVSRFIAVKLS